MNELKQKTSRRSLLQRSVLFAAGACGLRLVSAESQAADPPTPISGRNLTFYARSLRAFRPGQEPGKLPEQNGHLLRQGDLFDRSNGNKVGSFAATCFGSPTSFGVAGPSVANLEIQTVQLEGGTIFGIGSGAGTERVHAVLGGTGRFVGAQGSYAIRPSTQAAQEGEVEFVINLLT